MSQHRPPPASAATVIADAVAAVIAAAITTRIPTALPEDAITAGRQAVGELRAAGWSITATAPPTRRNTR